MNLSKIQIIKLLREVKPELGLKEAKDIVDTYEVKSFEDRLARAMGEDARNELYTWARLWAAKRGMQYPVVEYRYEVQEDTNVSYICEDDCCRPQS